MAYLKPQTPLKDLNSGDYFYPLTTIDQILLQDNSTRLSAILDKADFITNRAIYYNGTKLLSSGNIFLNDNQIAVNKTSITSGYNFEVNGNSYLNGTLLTQGARIQKVTIIPGQGGATTAGWRRCCSIESIYQYGNFLMFLSGGWNNGAPTIATLSFNLRNGRASISIVHCGFVGRISKIRLVKDDSATDKYWLDCYDEGAINSTESLYATFIGNVNINNITTNNEIYSATVTAAAEITLITLTFNSSGYVTLTTNQIISGQKTFTNTITGDILSTWHILAGRPSNTTNFRTHFETIGNLHHVNPARTDAEMSYNRFFASNSDQTTYGPGALNLPVVDQHVLSFGIDNNVVYSRHIALDIRTNKMFLGGRVNNTWQAWSEVIVHNLDQTITGIKTFNGQVYFNNNMHWKISTNWICDTTTDNTEWSFDIGNSTNTGNHWQVWSAKNSATILSCYNDDRHSWAFKLYGAVWNDYAEFRETKQEIEPGRCIIETGKGDLILSTKRLQEGCEIVSDTFGFAIGQSKQCNTPTAASGRVLAYPYEDRYLFKPGKPVCSGPNGTISIMTDEEARLYPWCIIGTVSEIPNYEEWQCGDEKTTPLKVNGRIWIRIR